MIEAQRAALLDARDEGRFASSALTTALENLDAEQISLELRGRPAGLSPLRAARPRSRTASGSVRTRCGSLRAASRALTTPRACLA